MKRTTKLSLLVFVLTLTGGALSTLPLDAQGITVRGKVVDAQDGSPLIGVGILTQTGTGTVTDFNGTYSLSVAPDGTLTFSSLGYEELTVSVSGRTTIDVALEATSTTLDELVVLGYTTQKKNEISSSVVSMGGEKLRDVTSNDVGNLLQGKAAGVLVLNSTGQPGVGAQIRIRGTGSISAGADPLYVVDGIAGGSFNANDVETITILKDASATALYGASAAGGVIVVTTKSAREEKPVVEFRANAGIKRALHGRFRPMDSEELYYTQKALYSQTVFNATRPKSLLDQDFDWMNAMFKTGVVQDYYLSASGKTGKVSYFASIDHYDEQGSLINTGHGKTSGRLNISAPVADRVTMNARVNYSKYRTQQTSSYVTLEAAYRALPWDNPYDEVTGEPVYISSQIRPDNGGTWYSHDKYNILHNELYNYAVSTGEDFMADLQLVWNITDWLSFTSSNRYSSSTWYYDEYIDPRTKSPSYGNDGYISNSNGWGYGIGTTELLKAVKDFGKHSVSGIIGYEYGESFNRELSASGNKMPNGQASLSNSVMKGVGGFQYKSRSWAALAQAQYAYAGKYIVTASIRYDETSRFAPKARGGFFPGVSGAWIISEENFMSGVAGVLPFLKLRIGYGKTGNDNIQNFLYQDTYALSAQYENIVAAVLERQANPNLGWEEAYMASLGIEGTFKPGINVNLDLYNTINSNLLLSVPRSPSTGFFSFMDNVGAVRNRGIELAVDGDIIKKPLVWNLGFNIGFNQNRVTYLPDGEFLQSINTGLAQQVKEGQDIYSWYMPKWAGVNPDNGDPQWEVVNEDGSISLTNDYAQATQQVCGTASPLFSGGISTSLSWKGITLSANGSFVVGNKIYNSTRTTMDSDGAYTDYNMMSIYNGLGWSRWEEPGDIATHPKLALGSTANSISSRFLEDGSFFRLRNVTLSYDLPTKWIGPLKGLRVFVSGDNLLTLSKFSGMDPEVRLEGSAWELAGTYSMNYPVALSVVGGINLKF